ncbi:MAG: cystathionine beta-lyase [Pseudomonadota bacterium]
MKEKTKLIHAGREVPTNEGTVNQPVYRASTILSTDMVSYLNRHAGQRRYNNVTYGATGTQNAKTLGAAVAALEEGYKCIVTASGLSAVTLGISALVQSGDHMLVTDSVYGPTRRFCSDVMKRYGVETTYYTPGLDPTELAALIRPETKLIYLEAPGSLTFEMQDIPGLAAVAKARGVLTAMDNTWATPLGFKPLQHGVDVSIQAGTKYLAGHSDLVIGMLSASDPGVYERVADHVMTFGDVAGPDDCYLTLRGMRTLAVRLRAQFDAALEIAQWLEQQPEVKRVMYPPLASDPGHEWFARDFRLGASLFGVALHTTDQSRLESMVNGFELFHIGSSWGGYESLVAVNLMPLPRDCVPWTDSPFLLRFHIGLEDPSDLKHDLRQALDRLS